MSDICYSGLAVSAINLDAVDILRYVLDSKHFDFPPYALYLCIQTRALKCFEFIFDYFCRNRPSSTFDSQVCYWIYNESLEETRAEFIRIVLKVIHKISTGGRKQDSNVEITSICRCKRITFLAAIFRNDTINQLNEESVPEIVMIQHWRLKQKYGDDYIEPFTQMPIDQIDPYLLYPSQDGRRVYYLPILLDFVEQTCWTAKCIDPITRETLTLDYIHGCQKEAKRIL